MLASLRLALILINAGLYHWAAPWYNHLCLETTRINKVGKEGVINAIVVVNN
jgi:hypothetical protein